MSKEDDWVTKLIKLGIGALAVYFLYKILTSEENDEEINRCPYCGAFIKKWAVKCPKCRRTLPGRALFA